MWAVVNERLENNELFHDDEIVETSTDNNNNNQTRARKLLMRMINKSIEIWRIYTRFNVFVFLCAIFRLVELKHQIYT